MLRTDNGTEFVNEIFARLCIGQTICHEHTGVHGPRHKGVVERRLDLKQKGGLAACLPPPDGTPDSSQILTVYGWERPSA